MAGTIQGFVPTAWDSRIDRLSPKAALKIAMDGPSAVSSAPTAQDGILADLCASRLWEDIDFEIQARTDAAETFAVAELLTARGVPFDAGTIRTVQVDFFVAGNAADETGWARHTALVSGGATPIVRVVTVPANTPVQVGGNTLSGVAGAGFAATPAVTVVAGAGTLTVNVVSAEAEILNWRVKIKIGKAVPLVLGV